MMSNETADAFSVHDDQWADRISALAPGQHLADSVAKNQLERTQGICRLLAHGPNRRVLDVGCGYAHLLRALASQGFETHGCDISSALIQYHKASSPFSQFTLSHLEEALPYDDGWYDVVVASEVIEHVYDVRDFILKLSRCLRPGGSMVLTTPYHGVAKTIAMTLTGHFDTHFDPLGQHVRFFTQKSLSHCLTKCGLEMTRFQGLGRVPLLWKTMLVGAVKQT